jgi:hypothetical protein
MQLIGKRQALKASSLSPYLLFSFNKLGGTNIDLAHSNAKSGNISLRLSAFALRAINPWSRGSPAARLLFRMLESGFVKILCRDPISHRLSNCRPAFR